jgi:hypothetical protein
MNMDLREAGEILRKGARLKDAPIVVTGMDAPPRKAMGIGGLDRCVAKALYTIARDGDPCAYAGEGHLLFCPGAQTWLGFRPWHPGLEHFISQGSKDYRQGEAEYLKRDAATVMRSREAIGRITAPAKVLGFFPVTREFEGRPLSLIVYGDAEQVRALAGLAHYGSSDALDEVRMPWGPTCASLVTYPAGMAEKMPKCCVVGPSDPTGDDWFPREKMSFAMPAEAAIRMAADLPSSFLAQRTKVVFPEHRALGPDDLNIPPG